MCVLLFEDIKSVMAAIAGKKEEEIVCFVI